ncbi:MAG: phosphotransferase, partial [Actinobacteria bacterium]|nr:phosphotransferase [Actinomycetota bacterium]
DVYALDGQRVLRRYRQCAPFQTEREARLIEHVRAHGFPTPAVHDVSETDLVFDRVDGPTMGDEMTRRPWAMDAHIRVLAQLHDRLHRLPAPEWLDHEPIGPGTSVVHLDLHPLNVLLSAAGPMVIDWTNAGRGPAGADVALTWVLLRTGVPDGHALMRVAAALGGRYVARRFARDADASGTAMRTHLEAAARYRLADPSLLEAERRTITRLVPAAS